MNIVANEGLSIGCQRIGFEDSIKKTKVMLKNLLAGPHVKAGMK